DLLADAEFLIAAVEGTGDRAVGGRVDLEVGVEKDERHPTDVDAPELRVDHLVVRIGDLDDEPLALRIEHRRDREARPVVQRILFGLPAVVAQDLAEIAFGVGEADADERETEIARGLEVITREHSEAT